MSITREAYVCYWKAIRHNMNECRKLGTLKFDNYCVILANWLHHHIYNCSTEFDELEKSLIDMNLTSHYRSAEIWHHQTYIYRSLLYSQKEKEAYCISYFDQDQNRIRSFHQIFKYEYFASYNPQFLKKFDWNKNINLPGILCNLVIQFLGLPSLWLYPHSNYDCKTSPLFNS